MYLWSFLTYGFLGYLLEKVYALVTRSRHTVRLLLQYHDIDLLSWKKLLRRRSAV